MHPDSDTVSIEIESDLISSGKLGVFFDYPYPDINKFDAPFVGVWTNASLHTTSLQQTTNQAWITHDIDATTYYTSIKWEGQATISGPSNQYQAPARPWLSQSTTHPLKFRTNQTRKESHRLPHPGGQNTGIRVH